MPARAGRRSAARCSSVRPWVMNCAQPPVRPGAEHAERGVLRARQLAGDLHDPLQHAVEGQVGGDADDRVEQQPEPLLVVDDVVDAVQQLAEQSSRRARRAAAAPTDGLGGPPSCCRPRVLHPSRSLVRSPVPHPSQTGTGPWSLAARTVRTGGRRRAPRTMEVRRAKERTMTTQTSPGRPGSDPAAARGSPWAWSTPTRAPVRCCGRATRRPGTRPAAARHGVPDAGGSGARQCPGVRRRGHRGHHPRVDDPAHQPARRRRDMLPPKVTAGSPSRSCSTRRRGHPRMLVVGRRGLKTFGRALLGSTSVALAGRSPVPVVVVPDDWCRRPLLAPSWSAHRR